MKAKVIATGEVVDVFHVEQHGCPEFIYQETSFNARRWEEKQLDFEDIPDRFQWHDASEELPDRPFEGYRYSDGVLVTDGDGYEVTCYDYSRRRWANFMTVTHWMFLPELPK